MARKGTRKPETGPYGAMLAALEREHRIDAQGNFILRESTQCVLADFYRHVRSVTPAIRAHYLKALRESRDNGARQFAIPVQKLEEMQAVAAGMPRKPLQREKALVLAYRAIASSLLKHMGALAERMIDHHLPFPHGPKPTINGKNAQGTYTLN